MAAFNALPQSSPLLSPGSIFEGATLSDSGGQLAESFVVADVNRDGKLDLLVANQCANGSSDCNGEVSVLLGKGDGTFRPAVSYASGGNRAFAVAVADVNGDGKPDLLVANSCATGGSFCVNGTMGVVGVLLGNGDGTFQNALTFSSGGFDGTAIAVKDLNGDGKADVVVVNQCADFICATGLVGVLLGNGDGTFNPAVGYGSGGYHADSVAVGDVNGDGKPDLVVSDQCASSGSACPGTVGVLLGNGDGTFQTVATYNAGGFAAYSVAIGDVNRDGKPDLVVAVLCSDAGGCASGAVSVLLGNGNGSFQSPEFYGSGGQNASAVTVADVDGDGYLDVLVANQCLIGDPACASGGGASVLHGNGDGSFMPAVTYGSGGTNAFFIAVADVSGDGAPDLVLANQCANASNCTGSLGVLQADGDGTFQGAVIQNPGGQGVFSIALEDVNGDGDSDMLIANQCGTDATCEGAVSVSLGNGGGSFGKAVVYPSGALDARSVAVKDVNADGKPDLLIANECATDSDCTGMVGVLLGNGDGTFQPVVVYNSGGQFADSVAVADVNRDGHPDLVVANLCADANCTSATLGVLLGNGDGTFQPAVPYSSGGLSATSVAVADVNGDGDPDLLVANDCAADSSCGSSGNAAVLLGNGDGTFQTAVEYGPGGRFPYSVVAADVNGDGKLDLLVANQCADSVCADGALGVLLGNGNGTFQPASSTAIPPESFAAIVLADFNNDGKLDVASGGGVLLLGNGDGSFRAPALLGASGFGIAAGDLNRDGRPDLVTGSVVVLLNINTQGLQTTTLLASSLHPSSFGQAVAFTARVKPVGTSSPTGTITFRDGEALLGAVVLTNRHALLTTSALSAGTHSIVASYSGDIHFHANASGDFSQVVGAVTTTTSVAASPEPSLLNQPVTYTANVTSQYGGDATGTVTFKDGAKTIATVGLAGNQASYSISYSTAGTHSIVAVYSGDLNNFGSKALPVKHYVEPQPVASKTVLTSSKSLSLVGQPVTFTAAVTSTFGPIPDGEAVAFYDAAIAVGNSPTRGGIATFVTSALSGKTHVIRATYLGDAAFRSSSGTVTQVVIDYTSVTLLTPIPNPSHYREASALTARVTPGGPNKLTGTVSFKRGSVWLGTSPVTAGVAVLVTTKLPVGTSAITATYNGDVSSSKSVGTANATVLQAVTTAAVSSSADPSMPGRIVRFTATVVSPTTPVTGTVTFMDGQNLIGTGNLSAGKANYSTATMSMGTHHISVIYHGTANISGCTSSPLEQMVK
jgi:hypothetical protein